MCLFDRVVSYDRLPMGRIMTNFASQWDDVVPRYSIANISWDGVAPIARRRSTLGPRDALMEISAFRTLREVHNFNLAYQRTNVTKVGFLVISRSHRWGYQQLLQILICDHPMRDFDLLRIPNVLVSTL
jgi:hypothetical protein